MLEYFENYVNNYAVVFDNYAHFSKIRRNYASTFYFKFGQNTSITMQQQQQQLLHSNMAAKTTFWLVSL